MAIREYQADGRTFYEVYVNVRSKNDPTLRFQKKTKGITSKQAALREEKKLFQKVLDKLYEKEAMGLCWGAVIEKWESEVKSDPFIKYHPTTIEDYVRSLFKWTAPWINRPASTINRADVKEIFKSMSSAKTSLGYRKSVKNRFNLIFNWGIEERIILGVMKSPAEGISFEKKSGNNLPEILTREQIKTLLFEAKRKDHPWYPIWAMAILTGMRNGELYALKWEKVDLEMALIRIDSSYNSKTRSIQNRTKAGYWRNTPISPELKDLLINLKEETGDSEFVLPRSWQWKRGLQAGILRQFCKEIDIPSIRFHTLRACFATHLLSDGVSPHKVMAAGGWRETKTMDIYSRLAGVDVSRATDSLKVLPKTNPEKDNVVELSQFRS